MNIRRFLTTAAAAVLVLAGTAAPAWADTTFSAPSTGVLYMCSFPGVTPQQVTAVEGFAGPGSVPAGETFSITDISGTIYLGIATRRLMRAVGYDGVRGTGMIPVTASNASPASSDGAFIPDQYWPPDTGQITFYGGTQSFVAGNPGVIAFAMGTPFTLGLQFHKSSNNSWVVWTMSCNVKVTNPAQNRAFTPDLPVT